MKRILTIVLLAALLFGTAEAQYGRGKWGRTGPERTWGRGGYGGKFSPTDILSNILACESDRGITMDDFNRVSQWDDFSGQGNHLPQAVGGNQPLFKTADGTFGNQPYILFTPEEWLRLLAFATGDLTPPFTIVCVLTSAAASTYFIYGSGIDNAFYLYRSANALKITAGTVREIHAAVWGGYSSATVSTTIWNEAASKYYEDLVEQAIAAGTIGAGAFKGVTVGGRKDATIQFNGKMAAFYVFNAALADADRINMIDYLIRKYK